MSSTRAPRRVLMAGVLLAAGAVVVGVADDPARVVAAPGDISGVAFRDIDHDGVQNGADQPEGGITVDVYNDDGLIATAQTDPATGAYAFSGLTDGPFRVEFTIPADRPGVFGTRIPDAATPGAVRHGTSVQFTPGDATDIDFGVADPLTFCESANPRVATVCYQSGVPEAGGKAILEHDFTDSGQSSDVTGEQAEVDNEPADFSIGAVWAVAHQRTTGTIYSGATMKRHVGLGPGGINAIYSSTKSTDNTDAEWFSAIDTTGGITVETNAARGITGAANPSVDLSAYSQVGKVGWGGMKVSTDDQTLFGINIGARTLAAIDIASVTDPATGTFTETAVPNPGCNRGEHRPWGLGQRDGKLYVGVVCDGTGAGALTTDLVAYVYEAIPTADPATGGVTFDTTPALTLPLDYDGVAGNNDKGCASDYRTPAGCRWNPWIDVYDPAQYDFYERPNNSGNLNVLHRPSPILSDIEFDDEGYMVLAFMDRHGAQFGVRNHLPVAGDTSFVWGILGGDTVLAAPDATFELWTPESNGSAGTRTAAAVSAGGPGGAEFFYDDDYNNNVHTETTQGALTYLPGSGSMMGTSMDPIRVLSGGVSTFNTVDGTETNALEYFVTPDGVSGPTFSKSGGLGDVSLLCDSASLQVGNYVWFDLDRDGIQDPSEAPIPGVQVELLDAAATTVLFTTTTDADGQYVFEFDGAGDRLLQPATDYQVRFTAVPTTDTSGVPGTPDPVTMTITQPDVDDPATADDDDVRDNDAVVDADPAQFTRGAVIFTTGGPGEHDHTLDAGYVGTLRVGNLVWFDVDNDGTVDDDGREAPIADVTVELWRDDGDGVFDPTLDLAMGSTLTDPDGEYRFEYLAPGDYFVAVPQAELDPGGDLAGLFSSTGNEAAGVAPDPDVGGPGGAGIDNDDNGAAAPTGVVTPAVTLSDDAEPTAETGGFAASGVNDEGDGVAIIEDADSNLTVDLGFSEPLRVGNLVWRDDDNDGTADPGEPPITGVLVQLLDATDAVIAEAVTDGDGRYHFDGLDAGTYRIAVPTDQTPDIDALLIPLIDPDALAGHESSTNGGANPTADATAGTDDVDDGEPDAANGWASITGPFDLAHGTAPADEGGDFDAGVGTDAEDAANGLTVPRADTNSDLSVDLGFRPLMRIGSLVWLDAGVTGVGEDDGSRDVGEPGIDGVLVQLLDDTDTVIAETVTDVDGTYWFDGLEPGDYRVGIPRPDTAGVQTPALVGTPTPTAGALDGLRSSTFNTGTDTNSADNEAANDDDDGEAGVVGGNDLIAVSDVVNLTPGAEPAPLPPATEAADEAAVDAASGVAYPNANSQLQIDFGLSPEPTYRIGNLVYADGNDNGVAETGEPGIAGVLVQLIDAAVGGTGGVLAETVTDPDGKYEFTDLPAGLYSVRLPADQTAIDTTLQPSINADALAGVRSSGSGPTGPVGVDADLNVDNDNDGNGDLLGGADLESGVLELGDGGGEAEPADETLRSDDATDDDPGTQPTPLPDTRSNLSVDFGIYAGVRIGNQVWRDEASGTPANDDNGTFDVGEVGIAGVTVELWLDVDGDGVFEPGGDDGAAPAQTAVTDTEGNYAFAGLDPATDVFVAVQQIPGNPAATSSTPTAADPLVGDNDDDGAADATNGYVSVTPAFTTPLPGAARLGESDTVPVGDASEADADAATVALPDGNSDLSIDLGFVDVQLYALGNLVWLDADNSGSADVGEPGIEGVLVQLLDDTGAVIAETVTAADGTYEFANLVAGEYQVNVPGAQVPRLGAQPGIVAGALDDVRSSGPESATPDDDADNDDNGIESTTAPGFTDHTSGPITLGDVGGEPAGGDGGPETVRADDPTDDDTATTDGIDDAQRNTTVDFGFYRLEVGNRIFLDNDNDEQFNGTDAGIGGVTVELVDATGTVVDTTTTAPDGSYLFTGVAAGTYTVQLPASNFDPGGPLAGLYSSDGGDGADTPADVDADPSDTDDNGAPANPTDPFGGGAVVTAPFDLAPGTEPTDEGEESPTAGIDDAASNLSVDLGLTPIPTLELGNQLWIDSDNDGTFDAGEPPVPDGVVVNLWTDTDGDGLPDTQIATTTTTGGTGQYLFDGLAPGTYIVQLDPVNFDPGGALAGFGPSTGPGSSTDPNDDVDGNNDGFVNPAVPGVITGPIELAPGTEPAGESDPASPGQPDTSSNLTVDIGLVPALELGNQIFIDAGNDGDGAGDAPAPAGVVVNLLDENGALVATTTTDDDGRYLFTGLIDGTYIVELPGSNFDPGGALEGYHPSTGSAASTDPNDDVDGNSDGIGQPDGSIRTGPVTLTSAGEPTGEADPATPGTADDFSNLTVDIGVYTLSFGDKVFIDQDNDGNQDPDDPPVAGVVVNLLDADGNPVVGRDGTPVTAITDADGNYVFDGLPEGDYLVEIDPTNFEPGGPLAPYVSSTPTDGEDQGVAAGPSVIGVSPVILRADGLQTGTPFGFTPAASVGDFVWVDSDGDGVQDPGEPGVGDVVLELVDADGLVVATTTTASDGSYLFDRVAPGDYTIRVVPTSLPEGSRPTMPGQGDAATGSDFDPTSLATPTFSLAPGQNLPDVDLGILLNGDLPSTGSEAGRFLRLAQLVLLAGAALWLISRRRPVTPTLRR